MKKKKKGQIVQFPIRLQLEEHRNLRVHVAREGKTINGLFRERLNDVIGKAQEPFSPDPAA
jgi:hypothetical protein